MNDLPLSQQPPTSDDTPARDTGVSRIHLSSVGLEQTRCVVLIIIIRPRCSPFCNNNNNNNDNNNNNNNKVSRSFLCLWFVVSQSVMPVELFVYLAEQNALL